MAITLNGTTGINTPGVVNTAAETVATTLSVTGITTIAAGSAAAPALVGATGGATTGVWFPAASTVAFANAGAETARIDSSGNLLVGSASQPQVGKLAVSFTQASSQGLCLQNTSASNSASFILMINSANGISGTIAQTGAATVNYGSGSDYRLKNNIEPMVNALTQISKLKPVTYKWIADNSTGQGFIAHELQEVVPDCVFGDKDAINEDGSIKSQMVDTSFLVATLTAAIQEQQALITSLTARITALENR